MRTLDFLIGVTAILVIVTASLLSAAAQEYSQQTTASTQPSVLYSFRAQADGYLPHSYAIFDKAGNLYGTAEYGGIGDCSVNGTPAGCGMVFEVSPPSNGKLAWTESVLYRFRGGMDGAQPFVGLTFDSSGNLYGTTIAGGYDTNCAGGCGTVFRLAPPALPGGTWSETIVYRFIGSGDGGQPYSDVILDQKGNLYGTTAIGGGSTNCIGGCGTVFQLRPPSQRGGNWTERVLYSFQGIPDAAIPYAGLVRDAKGNLYGTANVGGLYDFGVVFQLTAPSPNGPWTVTIIHDFAGGTDGANPEAPLTLDGSGNLYGTTAYGGGGTSCSVACGVVFKMAPPTVSGGAWTETLLYNFKGGLDGDGPFSALVFDSAGAIYGTTFAGGEGVPTCTEVNYGCGTVFKLSPATALNQLWTETILFKFDQTHGAFPHAGVIFGPAGLLYGTTPMGGALGAGVVFSLVP